MTREKTKFNINQMRSIYNWIDTLTNFDQSIHAKGIELEDSKDTSSVSPFTHKTRNLTSGARVKCFSPDFSVNKGVKVIEGLNKDLSFTENDHLLSITSGSPNSSML